MVQIRRPEINPLTLGYFSSLLSRHSYFHFKLLTLKLQNTMEKHHFSSHKYTFMPYYAIPYKTVIVIAD